MSGKASHGFQTADYAIFGATLIISTGIGLYHAFTGGKQRTTKEFFTGDRQLRTIPVSLSILVSFISAILVLGTPAEMYTRGTQLTMRTVGYCFACALSSILFVPLFYALKITSSFEYLERRFKSKTVKLMGSISMVFGSLFYMGLLMYTPATALHAVTGFPVYASVLVTALVATLYTTFGGMKAVIWTDVFQAMVMVGGMLAIVIQGTIHVGGLERVWKISSEGGRLIFYDFNPDPTQRLTTWSTIVGGTISSLTIFGIGQSSVQRYCSVPTLSQAKRAIYLNIPGLLIINILATLVGLVVYAYYAEIGCDPLRNGYISNSNQLVPYFVIDVLNYPGFPGIFLAVLFSGALSSMSSSLNGVAAVTWEDILKYFFQNLSEVKKTWVTKALVVFFAVVIYGAAAIGVSFLAEMIGGHVLQASLSFTGATSGPSLGMFLLGALVPFGNSKGAIAGFLVSMSFSLWLALGAFITRPYSATLPTSIENCNSTVNTTMSNWYSNGYHVIPPSDGRPLPVNIVSTTLAPQTPPPLTGLNRFYGISFLWYSAIGVLITLVIGILVSYITHEQDDEVNEDLLIPLYDRLCCCLPQSVRRRLQCGYTSTGSYSNRQSTKSIQNGTHRSSWKYTKSLSESSLASVTSADYTDKVTGV